MDWYEPDVQALELARKAREATSSPVVFYGSSTIRLWSDLAKDLRLPEALNLGFGGSTLEACAYFFDRVVTPENPRSLVLYAGDNDIGDGRLPEQIFEYFNSLAAKLRANFPAIPFGFVSIKPSPARAQLMGRMTQANQMIQNQIRGMANTFFINVFDAMLTPDGQPRTELFDSEGLHMNRSGYQLWTRLFEPYRNRIVTLTSSAIQADALTLPR